ncbi:MAG TPA: HEPN domain-containing protein [Allosphingosinicella sp.]|jgi:predicted nucleotidyltransferase/HEPN domain-containing protein
MSLNLDHLPEGKRRELEFVVAVIREGFAKAIAHRTQPRFRSGKLLKIVLFGSHARGDWVDDPVGRYHSDYDLLVVVDHEDLTDVAEFWAKVEDRLLKELTDGRLRNQASLIYHSLADVNQQLELGRYFFMDIVREGIVLHEEPGYPFAEPRPLSVNEALRETTDYYEDWFVTAGGFVRNAGYAVKDGDHKLAAFLLHQATERFYHCLILVRTLYSPRTHSLNRLRKLAEDLEPRLVGVWPRDQKFERRSYELLREAYVKARYSRHYRIRARSWSGSRAGSRCFGLVRAVC